MWLYRWLIAAIYASAARRDLRHRKSLAQAIPALDRLLADPAQTLAGGSVTIGPQRRPAASLFSGLLTAVVFWFLIAVFAAVVWKGLSRGGKPDGKVFVPATLAAAIVLSIVYTRRRYRGGQCKLTKDGLELTAGGDTVLCPWALFHAPGRPMFDFERGSKLFVRWLALPIRPEAVPHVEARREGVFLFAQGIEVHAKQFRFRSANEAELRAWYEVSAQDLAALLLQLAKTLGATLPSRAVTPQEVRDTANRLAPPATLDANGRLVASLTRLVFPPLCCGCGRPTDTLSMLALHNPVLRLGRFQIFESSPSTLLPVPFCKTCEEAGYAHRRKSALRPMRIAFGGPLFLGLLTAPLFRNPGVWLTVELMILVFLAVPLSVIVWLVTLMVARRRSVPVRVERYSRAQGAVALRFRLAGYAEQVLAASTAAGHSGPQEPILPLRSRSLPPA